MSISGVQDNTTNFTHSISILDSVRPPKTIPFNPNVQLQSIDK
jgi:hypothetical protein